MSSFRSCAPHRGDTTIRGGGYVARACSISMGKHTSRREQVSDHVLDADHIQHVSDHGKRMMLRREFVVLFLIASPSFRATLRFYLSVAILRMCVQLSHSHARQQSLDRENWRSNLCPSGGGTLPRQRAWTIDASLLELPMPTCELPGQPRLAR